MVVRSERTLAECAANHDTFAHCRIALYLPIGSVVDNNHFDCHVVSQNM